MHRRRGFTLIELIVIVAIVGMIAGIALPRLSGTLPAARLRGSGRTLASDLRYLYAYAVSRREYVRMAIDLDKDTYWAETFTPAAPKEEKRLLALHLTTDFRIRGTVREDDVQESEKLTDAIVGRRTLPKGVHLEEVTVADGFTERGGRAYIEFSPWGYGDDATIVLRLGDARRVVRLNGLVGEAGLVGESP